MVQAFTNNELRKMAKALPDLSANLPVMDTNADKRLGNHIGAFRITGQNGTRYVYGMAVYNTHYEEHKFRDRKSTRLNSSHTVISYAVFCLKKKTKNDR